MFHPEGTMWEVHRRQAIFLAGSRAMLMQLAYPPVAQAVADTRFLEENPLQRLRNTANAGIGLIYGTIESSQRIADGINHGHQRIHGPIQETTGAWPAGSLYDATDPKQLAWVAATLIDSSLIGYERFVKPLSDDQKDQYVAEAKQLFGFVDMPEDELPSSYKDLQAYITEMIRSEQVKVGPLAQKLAPYTMLSHTSMRAAAMSMMRTITADLLPPALKRQFNMPISSGQKQLVKDFAAVVRAADHVLPKKITQVAPVRQWDAILSPE